MPSHWYGRQHRRAPPPLTRRWGDHSRGTADGCQRRPPCPCPRVSRGAPPTRARHAAAPVRPARIDPLLLTQDKQGRCPAAGNATAGFQRAPARSGRTQDNARPVPLTPLPLEDSCCPLLARDTRRLPFALSHAAAGPPPLMRDVPLSPPPVYGYVLDTHPARAGRYPSDREPSRFAIGPPPLARAGPAFHAPRLHGVVPVSRQGA